MLCARPVRVGDEVRADKARRPQLEHARARRRKEDVRQACTVGSEDGAGALHCLDLRMWGGSQPCNVEPALLLQLQLLPPLAWARSVMRAKSPSTTRTPAAASCDSSAASTASSFSIRRTTWPPWRGWTT